MKPIVIKLILIIPMILLSVFIFNQIPKLDNIFIKVIYGIFGSFFIHVIVGRIL